MKLSKLFSVLFGILGAALMGLTLFLCLQNRNAQPRLEALPPEAAAASEAFLEALSAGDYETVRSLIHGQPELGLTAPTEEIPKLVWESLQSSLSCAFDGGCYSQGTNIFRDMTLTYLDAAAVSDAIPGIAKAILAEKTAAAEDPTALFGEDGVLRSEVSQTILREAAAKALADGETATVSVTLQLFQQDGRWLILPDRSILTALSGGTQ